jgi:four helix bundle protein
MSEKGKSIIAKKAFNFAIDVIKTVRLLPKIYENIIILKQIIRSATSVGANIEEALGAYSKRDFIHSMNIAKKEARETYYWLRILDEITLKKNVDFSSLMKENQEIISILTSIVKSSQENS